MPPSSLLRVAAVHGCPVPFSPAQTTAKVISQIHAAASRSANLLAFPETHISAFPVWSSLIPPVAGHALFARMVQASIYADGDEVAAIQSAAKDRSVWVSIGISEKARYSSATLWNSNLIIGPDGKTHVHHRKLCPTWWEKLTWSAGDGNGLRVVGTPWGKIGSLICGENTNPLARYAMMAQGEQVHISSWPALWPSRKAGDAGNYNNVAANKTRTAAHCFEAKCFGISVSGFLDEAAKSVIAQECGDYADMVKQNLGAYQNAATMILSPTGANVKGWTLDSDGRKIDKDFIQDEEDILYADLDISQCIEGKQYHDVVGGYQRLDVFDFQVDRTRREPAKFQDAICHTESSRDVE